MKRLIFAAVMLAAVAMIGTSFAQEAVDVGERDAIARAFAAELHKPLDWRPASRVEAEAAAVALGLGESCGNRCWDCNQGECPDQNGYCPFFSCTANCAAGHHPVCCWGCEQGPPPGTETGCDPPKERDYKAIAEKLIETIEAGDPEGVLESCGSRCDSCNDCNRAGDCPHNGCCDPVDCWDNCLEKQHPVCCAGC